MCFFVAARFFLMCSISCEFFLNYLIGLYIFLCVRSRPRSTVAVVSESVPLICGAAEVKCYETEILIGEKEEACQNCTYLAELMYAHLVTDELNAFGLMMYIIEQQLICLCTEKCHLQAAE